MFKLSKIDRILSLSVIIFTMVMTASLALADEHLQHPDSHNWEAGRPEFRGFTPRELQPFGQMRADIQYRIAKFRLIRTQRERRPRDARAIGPQSLGPVGESRPEIVNMITLNRSKLFGGGFMWAETGGANYAQGWTTQDDEPTDMANIQIEIEGDKTQWWEEKVRGQGQRGGWFRARFGGGGGGGGGSGGGGIASAMQQGGMGGLSGAQSGGGMQNIMNSMESGAAGTDEMSGGAPGAAPGAGIPGGGAQPGGVPNP
ncbi:MAG: hypothetical protein ACE5GM_07390 [bacterium]